jgi:hypothetical protein
VCHEREWEGERERRERENVGTQAVLGFKLSTWGAAESGQPSLKAWRQRLQKMQDSLLRIPLPLGDTEARSLLCRFTSGSKQQQHR